MYEPITLERLDNYTEIVKEYDFLLQQKAKLTQKISTISGVDYSKEKLTGSNGSKTSQEEHYVISLEKINKKIQEYSDWLKPEHEIIKNQIARIKKWNYRKILVLRYLEKWKWMEIIDEFFGCEDDFDEEKNYKYKDKIMYWNRQARSALENISAQPYIKVQKCKAS